MSKGYVQNFVGLYRSILTDVAAYHPTIQKGLDRDLSRITSLSSTMGAPLFTVHLPALDKLLTACLETGRLTRSGLPLTRGVSSRTMIPRLFSGLWSRVIDDSGCLKQNIDPNDIIFLRTLFCVGKKNRPMRDQVSHSDDGETQRRLGCSSTALYETIKEFYDVEESLPPSSHIWDGDGSSCPIHPTCSITDRDGGICQEPDLFGRTSPDDSSLLALVQRVADQVAVGFGEFLPSEHRFRHGPGAVSDLPSKRRYKYRFPGWSPRLDFVFPREEFGFPNASLLADDPSVEPYQLEFFREEVPGLGFGYDVERMLRSSEHHSRLIAVPKTQKAPRLIAAEPTCHQWCQQSVKSFLDEGVKSGILNRTIDFRRQDYSRNLALESSTSRRFATLDLSSASDRLSCWLVERIFRKNSSLLAAMIASRTRYIRNEEDAKRPKLHKLRKFASMGSALTFPVQSIVFSILCAAAGMSLQPKLKLRQALQQVRVYGDDLIVPVAWVPRVVYILERLYLRVNLTKSFVNGKFREACGMDAYDGHCVTPSYVSKFYSESAPSSLISVVAASNNLFSKGFWHTATYLMSTLPSRMVNSIPLVSKGEGTFGLVTTSKTSYNGKNRWNSNLHRWEARNFCVKQVSNVVEVGDYGALLQFFTESLPEPPESESVLDKEFLTGFGCGYRSVGESLKLVTNWGPV